MFDAFKKNTSKVINVNDIDELLNKIELIDIREPYEYEAGSLKNSKNIPMDILLKEPQRFLKKENTYYIICQSGGRSERTVSRLSKAGFDVINVSGGMGSYVGNNRK